MLLGHSPNNQFYEFLAESPYDRPRVNKFAEDIYYDVYYSNSAVYDYVKAFFTGYNF